MEVGRASRALALLLLCCSTVCGPAQTVDRGAVTLQPDSGPDTPARDGPSGTGGYSGSGGGSNDDPDGGGGTGGPTPDADDNPEPDAQPPDAPDAAAQPDSAPAPDAASEPAPQLPLVQVSTGAPPASTDLTAEGTADWRHWGLNSASASNRKRNVPGTITMTLTQSTVMGRYNDRPVRFSWSDGNPTVTADTPDGIVVGDSVGRGYEIRVIGNPARARTVRVYVGVWGARARMNISLSGQSGSIYVDSSLTAQNPGADRVYTVTFQPAVQSQALVLRWTVESLNQQFGNVTLQAVTVAESP